MNSKTGTEKKSGRRFRSGAPKISAEGVSVTKGGVHILDGIDLEVESGEFLSIVGPSGAGKSTLLGLFAGLERPDSGSVKKDGEPLLRPESVSFMPQSDLLLPWRDVRANVALGLEATGTDRNTARRRATDALLRFGLQDFARLSPESLSGGMRSRVALLRTALLGRDVLLLDEPFGALDAITRRDLRSWLLEVRDEISATVVLVTHDVDEALMLSERVIVLSRRPARISADIHVPFDRAQRDESAPEFVCLKSRIVSMLDADAGGTKS
ncbi:ABC transporter ATP-binding protein [Rubrobacter indicoceani]|uniref:ABC transporter ATP-binding protein n=1 Tax=Rubrobacter indicoceani TaxID=2051957 RepID=UPI000E5BD8A4|nr:ABC transporter ATP-binding protein [Rubrobacter indicoceani]